ncbi:MAG: class I SAM-dependent methyltransferase [Verrucomicrobiota bacterium]
MTHEEKITQWIGPGKIGTEVGAGGRPVPGPLEPPAIQVDCFKAFGADTCVADFYGHACALPFHDHALDYVLASHVLEHVANPVAALAEWFRVVRPGGIIYLIVPDRRVTWDRTRELTSAEHMLEDYARGVTASDATHIDEFAGTVHESFFGPNLSAEEVAERRITFARGLHETVARGEDINIHFHTFEPANLRELLETLSRPKTGPSDLSSATIPTTPRLRWQIVDFAEFFPAGLSNGVLAVLQVEKGWRALADSQALRIRALEDPRALLREAEPFADWAARTPGLGGVR